MSRTDVHRPARVQQADPHDRHRWRRHQMWATQAPELVPLFNTCGCPMCTAHHEFRADRRRDRHQARQQIRRDYAV